MKKNWGRRDNWAAWGEREIWISEIWFKEGKVWSKRIKWESWCDVMETCWTQNWFGERSHDQECGRRTRKLRTQSRIRADWGWEQKIKHFVEYRYCMEIPRQREEKEVLRKGRTRGSKAKEKQTKTINLRNMSREKIKKKTIKKKTCESVRTICDYQDLTLYPVTICLPQKAISKVCF